MRVALVAALLPVLAHAADADRVLGVQLGAALERQTIPTCAGGARHARPPGPCLEWPAPGSGEETAAAIWNAPELPFSYSAEVLAFRGAVSALQLSAKSAEFDRVLETLAARFGAPSSSDVVTMATIGGARMPSRVVRWQAGALEVLAVERGSRIDEALVTIEHKPTAAAMRAAREAAKRDKAGRL